MRHRMNALTLLLLLTLITGCASKPVPIPCNCPVLPKPALKPRDIPEWNGGTNRDLATHSSKVTKVAQDCEADKKTIRDANEP